MTGANFKTPALQELTCRQAHAPWSRPAYSARQILSMLVPPGEPMGSPQVMA